MHVMAVAVVDPRVTLLAPFTKPADVAMSFEEPQFGRQAARRL